MRVDAGIDRIEHGILVHDEMSVQGVALSRDPPRAAYQLD
jgi:hypothetical protein